LLGSARAAGHASDSIPSLNLPQCIDFALKKQPLINQALINESITRSTNAILTSGWWPQINVSGNFTHYNTLPTSFIHNSSGQLIEQKSGVVNTAIPVLSVTQTIFNPSLVFALRSRTDLVRQAELITDSSKINVVATVSKTFYSLLLTIEQIGVLQEDTARLGKTYRDTYHQFVSGIVDETDFDQAAISLNNSRAQLRQAQENVVPQYAALKQAMGYPPGQPFYVSFDTAQMLADIQFDTTQTLQFEKRIEYQQLMTAKRLQEQNIGYYRTAWAPTLSGFFNFDYVFQNNKFADLFSSAYPYSYVGLSVSLPIFTGFARTQGLRRAKLQAQLLDWDEISLRSQIYSEYTAALANYKSNLYNLYIMQDNVALAKKVYDIVSLQYISGVVPYLNVITAESNLISSEIGYLNALFQLLSSKIDLEKSMGFITVNR